ncbi:DoxX family protein [Microlunatus ginsengisoli]|jgi:putative oxidoreductase|uniref:Oxidoreductase n=1 Tax=Microlunatus ginsengisoli TaxID=363863 RepID=A0ABP7A5Y5_9ACTN
MVKFLAGLRSIALLIARVALGGILIAHGYDRWQVRHVASQIDYLNQYGVPYADWAAWGSIVLELVGGIFLVFGALTPLVALAVVAQQALIIAYISWRRGPWLLDPQNTYVGGYEYNVALGSLALLLAVFGAGAISIDRLFRRKKTVDDEDEEPTTPGPTRAPAPGATGTTTTMPAARPTTYTPPSGGGTPNAPSQYSNSGAPAGR